MLNLKQIKLQLLKKQAFHIISFVFGAFLFLNLGCKTSTTITSNAELIRIDSSLSAEVLAQKMIQPYKESLDAEMNEVLVISAIEFPKEKDKPETLLGNFVDDLSLKIITEKFPESNINFCLLNNGGLRTSLPKGEITRGKIFELMPFDNELVIVSLNSTKAKELIQYIYNVRGQPISGVKLDFTLPIDTLFKQLNFGNTVNVVTTDYLAYGGDKMDFFLNPMQLENTQLKLRDAIIEFCINENKKGKKITSNIDGRIHFK